MARRARHVRELMENGLVLGLHHTEGERTRKISSKSHDRMVGGGIGGGKWGRGEEEEREK